MISCLIDKKSVAGFECTLQPAHRCPFGPGPLAQYPSLEPLQAIRVNSGSRPSQNGSRLTISQHFPEPPSRIKFALPRRTQKVFVSFCEHREQ